MPIATSLAAAGFVLLAAATIATTAAHSATPAESAGGANGSVFPFRVQQKSLDNGLRVIVIPYDSPGTVAFFMVVRTGSRDEVEPPGRDPARPGQSPGHSGFAHFFEHMMFRGTEKYSQDRYNETIKGMGADSNASTADDVTRYYIVGPASQLETIMDMESDRFKNLKYSEEAFRTEALAVLGEYNKSASSPYTPMVEKLRDLAFTRHTYKHTTIGFVADIKAMPGYYQYSLQFFNRFYRPENCTLMLVGDVDAQRVFALARRYFGDWKKGYQPAPVAPEPPQSERKEARIDWPNPTRPRIWLGYHMPAFSTRSVDSAALDAIGELLFSESAPLYRELVIDRQWVDFLQGGPQHHRDPYLFMVLSQAKSEDLVGKIRETIDRHIRELRTNPVDEQRLAGVKSHVRYAFALRLDTPRAVADQVTEFLALSGDLADIDRYFAQYQRVTPADVQRLAREVFRPQNETIVILTHPADKPGTQRPVSPADHRGGAGHD
ncbi:MAG TPA: pitrilysin family protein [Thermoanaerobaculia bacterium]|nr:pitrilysin family protein [Thermoanaerobaculia bacterium]